MAEFLLNIPIGPTVQTAAMAIAARKAFHAMADVAGVSFDHSPAGILHFYETQHLRAAQKVTVARRGWIAAPSRNTREIRSIEPRSRVQLWAATTQKVTALATSTNIHGTGIVAGTSGRAFCPGRGRSRPCARYYVEIDTDQTHRFDGVIVSAGVGSRGLARQFGDRVNIYPVKGYSITVNLHDAASQAGAPTVSLLDDAAKIVTSRLGKDRFRVAGTAEFNGENRDIRADRVKPLVQWVERYFPDVSTEDVVPWAGLRPMMPSMMPRVGRGKHPRVFYNTGHGHLGWTLSAATAEMVAAQVADAQRSGTAAIGGSALA